MRGLNDLFTKNKKIVSKASGSKALLQSVVGKLRWGIHIAPDYGGPLQDSMDSRKDRKK